MGVAITTGGVAECSEGAEFKPEEMIGESLKDPGLTSDYKLYRSK